MNQTTRVANPTRRPRCAGDAGASVLEVTLAVPVLLLLTLASVHIGLWFHARNVVTAATQEATRAVRSLNATDDDGQLRATQFVANVGGPSITNLHVNISHPDPDTVTVHIAGGAPAIVPGLQTTVEATVTSPVEKFRP